MNNNSGTKRILWWWVHWKYAGYDKDPVIHWESKYILNRIVGGAEKFYLDIGESEVDDNYWLKCEWRREKDWKKFQWNQ